MEDRFAQIRIREQLNMLHAKLFLLELDIKIYPNKEKYARSPAELKKTQDREYFMRRKILERKFAQLMSQKQKSMPPNLKLDAVVNLSSKELSEEETNVLARGFKFRPTLEELPIKEIIIGTEALIKTAGVQPDVASRLRNMTIKEIGRMQDLEKRRPTKKNLSTKEWKAVKTIAADKSIRVVPADKGDKSIVTDYGLEALDHKEDNSTVVDEGTYLSKLQERIITHTKIDFNPVLKHEKQLNLALQKMHQARKHMPTHNKDKDNPLILSRESLLQFTTQGAIPPQLRGQIKDHKDGNPMREISDASRSPGHKLAKILNKLFEPYTRQTKTAVNGGRQLIQFIREGRFDGNFLGSCDAVALYPSIIVEEGLELLEGKILEDDDLERKTDLTKPELTKLTRLVTEELYFECEFGFFQQNGGNPNGRAIEQVTRRFSNRK